MSALDLFASALGAFILMTIVMIPTFPNVSPVDIIAPPSPDPPPPAPPAPSVAQFPPLDLVIVLDVTRSMRRFVAGGQSDIDNLTQVLSVMTPSLWAGVVAYGDRNWQQGGHFPFALRELSGNQQNLDALRTFVVDEIRVDMGCSVPVNCPLAENDTYEEDLILALRAAYRMDWREDSERKVILVLTDAPGYPDDERATIDEVRRFAGRGDDYRVSTVFFDTGEYRHPEFGVTREAIEAFLQDVSNAGGGQYVAAGASFVASVILALME